MFTQHVRTREVEQQEAYIYTYDTNGQVMYGVQRVGTARECTFVPVTSPSRPRIDRRVARRSGAWGYAARLGQATETRHGHVARQSLWVVRPVLHARLRN